MSASHRGSLLDRRRNATVNPNARTFQPTTDRVRGSLIIDHEEKLIDMVNSANGNPLLCDAIVQRQPESARLLLELARRHDRFVILETGCCRTLDWAMSSRAEVVAKYVLDCVAKQKLPMEESCCILTNYLFPLSREFPRLMKNYIRNDSFAFEYARFSVPRSLIDTNGKRAIAMTSDEPPERFRGLTAETARAFWVEHCKEHSEDLKESIDFQIEMSAKFLCVEDPTVSTKGNCRKEPLCVYASTDRTSQWRSSNLRR